MSDNDKPQKPQPQRSVVVVVLEVEHAPGCDLRAGVVERAGQLARHSTLTATGARVGEAAAVVYEGMTAAEYIATLRYLAAKAGGSQ